MPPMPCCVWREGQTPEPPPRGPVVARAAPTPSGAVIVRGSLRPVDGRAEAKPSKSSLHSPRRIISTVTAIALVALSPVALSACGGDDDVPRGAVADVDGKPVTQREFDHWLQVVNASQQPPSKNRKKPPKPPKRGSSAYNQLRDQVVQFLVSARWIEGEAADRDVTTNDKEVQRQFRQTRDQSFPSKRAYERFLETSGQSQEDILFRVRLDVLSNKLRQKLTTDVGEVSDDEIKDYFEENKQQFSQPERRDLQVVRTKTEDKANEALRRLKDGDPFKDVVKDLSNDPASKQQEGKLLGVAKGQQDQTFDEAIFSAKKDELAGPVKTQGGFYVFKVTRITPASEQSLEQSKESIRQLLLSQKQQQALDAFTQEFRKKWRDRTDCAKGYITPDCSNGEEPPQTPPGAPGGPQPPAKSGTGVAPALEGAQAPAVPGLPPGAGGVPGGPPAGGAATGPPATSGAGTAPALGGGAATGLPPGVQVPQGAPPQGAPPQQGAPPPGG
jgi:foldase protein PrsA